MDVATKKQGKHFLVHGERDGCWRCYKVKSLLEDAGQKVTALDLAASGIDLRKLEQLNTLHESLPREEKVILVGHNLGGMNL
uniref:AB hydrolase-1 domain-containing protein n=1 Tax=Solanum lycopersicum TaxID=4081 RepID=A0A3Q7I2V1_SOLLC